MLPLAQPVVDHAALDLRNLLEAVRWGSQAIDQASGRGETLSDLCQACIDVCWLATLQACLLACKVLDAYRQSGQVLTFGIARLRCCAVLGCSAQPGSLIAARIVVYKTQYYTYQAAATVESC